MKSILCKIIGHRYSEESKSNIYTNNYECKNCHQKFTTDGYGTIIKLTSFWKENNLMFKKYIQENKV